MGFLRDGPNIHPSKGVYTLLMRALIAVLILTVVVLVALEPMLTRGARSYGDARELLRDLQSHGTTCTRIVGFGSGQGPGRVILTGASSSAVCQIGDEWLPAIGVVTFPSSTAMQSALDASTDQFALDSLMATAIVAGPSWIAEISTSPCQEEPATGQYAKELVDVAGGRVVLQRLLADPKWCSTLPQGHP